METWENAIQKGCKPRIMEDSCSQNLLRVGYSGELIVNLRIGYLIMHFGYYPVIRTRLGMRQCSVIVKTDRRTLEANHSHG